MRFEEQDRIELKKALTKLKRLALLTIVPLVLWEFTEIFILPVNQFTFRQWEAVNLYYVPQGVLPGVFYPLQDITMMAAGDQDKNRNPIKKVRFVTDQYGQRNYIQPEGPKTFDYVFIGYSSFGGSHIDQPDMLAEVTKRMCNCDTYTYGSGIIRFFNEPRFKAAPPKNIVYEIRRGDVKNEQGWNITGLIDCNETEVPTIFDNNGEAVAKCEKLTWEQQQIAKLPTTWQIYLDRFHKQIFFNYAKATLGLSGSPNSFGPAPKNPDPKFVVERAFKRLRSYHQKAKVNGINLIVFYYPWFERDWDGIVPLLEKEGIQVVGNLPDDRHVWDRDDYLRWHHKEDNHWLESSIRETAEKIVTLTGTGSKQTHAF